MPTDTPRERLRAHLAQAKTRATDPDARAHIDAALELCADLPPTPLAQCPACGRVGPRPRIRGAHDCPE